MKENSIEEDIKLLEELDWLYLDKPEIICDRYEEATNHILSDYKRVLKENEGLRKELNEENKRCMMLAIEKQDYFEKYRYHLQQNERLTKEFSNVILVQKVKDKIEELNDVSYAEKLEDIMNRKNYTITELVQYVLRELIEGEN